MQFIDYEENVMEAVKKTAENYSSNFFPFLVVAKLNGLPFRYYLSVFDIVYQFDSFTAAFDYLFKAFFVMNVSYPSDVKSFYIFVQQFIYGIYIKEMDRKFPNVIDLIYDRDQSRLPSQQE